MPEITMLFAGIFGIMAVVLGSFPGLRRAKLDVSVGHGNDPQLELGMRRHANFIENVPLALILLGLIEMNGAAPIGLYILGTILFAARLAHAIAFTPNSTRSIIRGLGAGGSVLVIIASSVWGFYLFFTG